MDYSNNKISNWVEFQVINSHRLDNLFDKNKDNAVIFTAFWKCETQRDIRVICLIWQNTLSKLFPMEREENIAVIIKGWFILRLTTILTKMKVLHNVLHLYFCKACRYGSSVSMVKRCQSAASTFEKTWGTWHCTQSMTLSVFQQAWCCPQHYPIIKVYTLNTFYLLKMQHYCHTTLKRVQHSIKSVDSGYRMINMHKMHAVKQKIIVIEMSFIFQHV